MQAKPPSPTSSNALRQRALRLLAQREHTQEELRQKLEQIRSARAARTTSQPSTHVPSEAPSDEVTRVIAELASEGWQSDARYAEALVRRLGNMVSRRYLAQKLAQLGIARETANAALATRESSDAEVARTLWERRFGRPPASDKERARQIRFLLNRGFQLSEAFRIVPQVEAQNKKAAAADVSGHS